MIHLSKIHLHIHVKTGEFGLIADPARRDLDESVAELREAGFLDGETGSGGMAPKAIQEAAAGRNCLIKIKAPHPPRRSPADTLFIDGNHHCRPMKPLHQPGCHDPYHPYMPASRPEHERGRNVRSANCFQCFGHDLFLDPLPVPIQSFKLLREHPGF